MNELIEKTLFEYEYLLNYIVTRYSTHITVQRDKLANNLIHIDIGVDMYHIIIYDQNDCIFPVELIDNLENMESKTFINSYYNYVTGVISY